MFEDRGGTYRDGGERSAHLKPNQSRSISNYPEFLEHVAHLIRSAKESVSKATRHTGEKAARKVATRFVVALLQRFLQPSLLSELEGVTPGMSSNPEVTHRVDEIMNRLSREDEQ